MTGFESLFLQNLWLRILDYIRIFTHLLFRTFAFPFLGLPFSSQLTKASEKKEKEFLSVDEHNYSKYLLDLLFEVFMFISVKNKKPGWSVKQYC